MSRTNDTKPQADQSRTRPTSLTALQCELRRLFDEKPTNRALAEVLRRIGSRMSAVYAVVHTRIGVNLLSEEWECPGSEIDSETREIVNTALWESISSEESRCARMPGNDEQCVLVTAVMYDGEAEPSGGAALVIRGVSRERMLQVVTQLEGVLGFLALLIGDGRRPIAERREIRPHRSASHPMQLAHAIVSEMEARYGFDLTALGLVTNGRVRVAAITGIDEVRQANPGVAVIRSAMEECLDQAGPVVHVGGETGSREDDHRLHAQWSHEAGDNPVASLPLIYQDEVVAVLSMSQGAGTRISREQVQLIAEEISGYAALIPLARQASRSLAAHARDLVRERWQSLLHPGRRRTLLLSALMLAAAAWLTFGSLHYTFTVPCVVKAENRRTISCPRDGVLAELFVQPGDRVRSGQLLAALDAKDEYLQHAELTAEAETLTALIDHAIATRDSGQQRVYEAQKHAILAQLAVVEASIGQAQIRAPQDGIILAGDLREQLGGRLKMGEALFEVARYDRAAVELRIPERLVLPAYDHEAVQFSPSARPSSTYRLEDLRIAPASTVIDGANVFLAEGTVPIDLEELPPGMEGIAHVDAGPRRAFWVLTHRLTDWLRLNFWL